MAERDGSGARRVLAEVFGFAAFRPGQEAVIEALLAGGNALAVMPTGSGKSLCQRRRKNVPARRRKNVPGSRWQLVPVVHGKAPRAGRRALRVAGGGPRVGGACGPTGPSGGLFGRLPAS